jgi:hypothetical protein
MARVQPPLRPPVRVDMDEPQNETMVCPACDLNFVQLFCPRTLANRSGSHQPNRPIDLEPFPLVPCVFYRVGYSSDKVGYANLTIRRFFPPSPLPLEKRIHPIAT